MPPDATVGQQPVTEPGRGAQRPTPRAVFDAGAGYVMQSLRRLGVQEREVEDVTQEVFLAVFQRLGDYDPERPLRRWLFGFARRVAADHRRQARHRHEVLDDLPETPDRGPGAEAALSDRSDRRVVLRALDVLDQKSREVFVMYYLDDCTTPEIAADQGESDDAVTSRLRRAHHQVVAEVRRILKRAEAS